MKRIASVVLSMVGLLSTTPELKAQSILTDQKGSPLFAVPSSFTTPELSSKNVGITTPIVNFKKIWFYVVDASGDTIYTAAKSHTLNLTGNIVENTKNTTIFSKNTNISPSIELGYNVTLDTIFDAGQRRFFSAYGVSVSMKYLNVTVYDKATKSIITGDYQKFSPGIKGNYNLFWRTIMAVAITGNYQYGVNVDNLTSFQNLTSSYYSDANVASNGKVDGYLSPLNNQHLFRFSIALPMFFMDAFAVSPNQKLQFVPTPYYFFNTTSFSKAAHNVGIGLSILNKRIYQQKDLSFKGAVSLNINYNLVNSGDKENPRFVFISGTYAFGGKKANKKEYKEN